VDEYNLSAIFGWRDEGFDKVKNHLKLDIFVILVLQSVIDTHIQIVQPKHVFVLK